MRVSMRMVTVVALFIGLTFWVHWKVAFLVAFLYAVILLAEKLLHKDFGKLFYVTACFLFAYVLLNSIWGDVVKSIKMMLAFALVKYGIDTLTKVYGFEPGKVLARCMRFLFQNTHTVASATKKNGE